jgi:hypothetical protein
MRSPGRAPLLVSLALAAAVGGCSTRVGRWTYPCGKYPTAVSPRRSAAVVAVEPFLDLRGEINETWLVWGYVPLLPYGAATFERPDATQGGQYDGRFDCTPTEDLAKAAAAEIEREGLAARVFFTFEPEEAAATHVLRGRIRSFENDQTMITYCISYLCQVLWYLGVPQGTSYNSIWVDLELWDRSKKSVVWRASLAEADDYVENPYYGPEYFRFPAMYERRLREAMGGLATALGAEPAPLPPRLVADLATTNASPIRNPGVDGGTPPPPTRK